MHHLEQGTEPIEIVEHVPEDGHPWNTAKIRDNWQDVGRRLPLGRRRGWRKQSWTAHSDSGSRAEVREDTA